MAQPDSWSETAWISITKKNNTNDMEFYAITETIDIDIGDKDFDVISTLSGGRLVKFTPQEPTTVTLEAYPVEAGTTTGTTGKGFYDLMHSQDTSQALQISSDRVRTEYQVVILWSDDTTITSAKNAIGLNQYGLRVVLSNGYFTSVKPSFTDGVLKFTVTFKCPPFNSAGTSNVSMDSADGTSTLTTVAAYT